MEKNTEYDWFAICSIKSLFSYTYIAKISFISEIPSRIAHKRCKRVKYESRKAKLLCTS